MVSNLMLGGIIASLLWLLILSILFWRLSSHYNSLARGQDNKTLKEILEDLLKEVSVSRKELDVLKGFVDKAYKEGQLHIQKVGLVRFNPFKDTGGDQSFILSLIDGKDTGVIISGLYSRSGTRWYAKKIVGGKSLEHELSEDEKRALEEARSVN